MRASGLVDIESHSHLHQRLFVAKELTGFVTRESNATASDAVFSPYLTPGKSACDIPPGYFEGFPLFPTLPLLGAPDAVALSADAVESCVEVFGRALAKFGSAATAVGEAMNQCRNSLTPDAFTGMSAEEVGGAIRDDLYASQCILRIGLRDSRVGTHLCLPFTTGCAKTVAIARELGFGSIFWGVNPGRRSNLPGMDAMHIVRLKNDFIWRLPGKGRRSLAGVYLEKSTRRLSGLAPY